MAKYSREKLLKWREELIATSENAQEERDKQILTLSAAALALSLTFYKDVLASQIGSHGWLLFTAWTCWSTAILSVVISMSLSARVSGKQLDAIDVSLSRPGEELEIDLKNATLVTLPVLRFFNVISLISFVIGMASFAFMFFLSIHS